MENKGPSLLSVGDACAYIKGLRGVDINPRRITEMTYRRSLPFECPLIGGRRMIPAANLGELVTHLEERGVLTKPAKGKK